MSCKTPPPPPLSDNKSIRRHRPSASVRPGRWHSSSAGLNRPACSLPNGPRLAAPLVECAKGDRSTSTERERQSIRQFHSGRAPRRRQTSNRQTRDRRQRGGCGHDDVDAPLQLLQLQLLFRSLDLDPSTDCNSEDAFLLRAASHNGNNPGSPGRRGRIIQVARIRGVNLRPPALPNIGGNLDVAFAVRTRPGGGSSRPARQVRQGKGRTPPK